MPLRRLPNLSGGLSGVETMDVMFAEIDQSAVRALPVGEFLRFRADVALEAETDALARFACADSTPLSRSAAVYTYATEFFASVSGARISLAERARRFLEQHYAEALTLDDVAAAVLSPLSPLPGGARRQPDGGSGGHPRLEG